MNTTLTTPAGNVAAEFYHAEQGELGEYMLSGTYEGTVHARPHRLGMHPCFGVMITFGGWAGHLEAGSRSVSGTVLVQVPGFIATRYPGAASNPLEEAAAQSPVMAEELGQLAAAIAEHYVANYAGAGRC